MGFVAGGDGGDLVSQLLVGIIALGLGLRTLVTNQQSILIEVFGSIKPGFFYPGYQDRHEVPKP